VESWGLKVTIDALMIRSMDFVMECYLATGLKSKIIFLSWICTFSVLWKGARYAVFNVRTK